MSENKKVFPRKVKVVAADNGYLVTVGCYLFVVEGDSKNLIGDLKRYLECDKTIAEKYGYKGGDIFFSENIMDEEECEKEKCCTHRSPAFNYIRKCSNRLISCIYYAGNGIIEVDMEKETVMVKQKKFENPKVEDI